MTKVFLVNGIGGNILDGGLINNGKFLKFGYGGKYIGEFVVPFNPDKVTEVDMLSFLNVDNNIELGYVISNTFHKVRISSTINEIIKGINSLSNGNIFVGRREGKLDDVNFIQYFYGYKKGYLKESHLLEVLRGYGGQ